MVVALIVHGVVTVGIVFWLNLIADVFDLDSSENLSWSRYLLQKW